MRAKIYMKSKLTSADNHHYEKNLESVQNQLSRIQQAYFVHGERAVIVLEGLDASGKGGLIRRLAWAMDPRGCHVWPISAPDEAEKREHYMQRFWRRLPAQGSLAVFDRSWYGRVLVERVEGLCKPNEWKRAYREINEFERDLVDNGFKVIKIFLQISSKEQLKRFRERLSAPEKRWKLTFEDFRNCK
jgi:polyphosphate kinase 2 (PPK2 family)